MVDSPSADNYQLGKGVLYFNQKSGGSFLGELDLGNAPDFSFNVSLEKLEHFSSRGGLRAKDKSVVSQITPGCSFSLDEINAENLKLLVMGTATTVAAASGAVSAEVATGNLGRRVQLANRGIGATKLTHGTVTSGPFVIGDTVTGGTTSQTGVISYVDPNGTYIYVVNSTGSGTDGPDGWSNDTETITSDGTGTPSADLTAVGAFVSGGDVLVTDSVGTSIYDVTDDWVLSTTLKDDAIGRILIVSDGQITDGESIKVSYDYNYAAYTQISAFTQTEIEGTLRFVSDNPVGNDEELKAWRVSLTPEGDTAMIGDDWASMSFTGEILKVADDSWDGVDHSANPYIEIILP